MPVLIFLVIFLFSHLTVDTSIDAGIKNIGMGIVIVLAVLYLIFGIAV